jgi:hypothetical protein
MNAVEIEQAVSDLMEAEFDPAAFPYAFLEAFGNKETTLKRLKSGNTNTSDIPGGLLQRNNIHIKVCPEGQVTETLTLLRDSPATARLKARFILATDGKMLEAENRVDDVPPLACEFTDLPNHFGFFLPLAGITTVRQIVENAFDIRATGRLNKLYVELLKTNPDWDTDARREELNHFFARLIFCFFAEDTGIFDGTRLFTDTLEKMSERDGSNIHAVLSDLFRAMNTRREDRADSDLRPWALKFPYVNGNLFSGSTDCPKFSKIARSYLLFVGRLDWKLINPDIFGSMIQAVADDEERGALGMHYTSVPNILKVLNPLFLDDLRQKLAEAGDGSTPASKGQLKRLRDRMARIRVFDPACGSGNFLVIAYKEMRQIEAVINERRGERELPSVIPSTNFRGIEIRHFAAEIARLALIIARFQCDSLHISHLFARNQVLPLDKDNWITCGNALRLDWLQICPPTGTGVKLTGDDLFNTPKDQAEIDFENAGGETYICGNPPYTGNKLQSAEQKADLDVIFDEAVANWRSLDYVAGWFMKAAAYGTSTKAVSAFVATNSICQGQQVPILWPAIFSTGHKISFAHTSFKWNNLASHNAGVTVVIIGLAREVTGTKRLFSISDTGETAARDVQNINAYLAPASDLIVEPSGDAINGLPPMLFGNMPRDGGHLLLSVEDRERIVRSEPAAANYLRDFVGSEDAIYGKRRVCVWVNAESYETASGIQFLHDRFRAVAKERSEMKAASTQAYAKKPYRFVQIQGVAQKHSFIVPRHSSESREYLPIALYDHNTIVADSASAVYDASLDNFAILVSRLHLVWVASVCGKLETRYRYSNTLGWNTFPVPALSESSKGELTRRAEEILLAREAHFPATIADLYDPEHMPPDLRAAHDRNDETLERVYIGRKFKNDTERLEKLFELYTQMTAKQCSTQAVKQKKIEKPGRRAKKEA